MLIKRLLFILFSFAIILTGTSFALAEIQRAGQLEIVRPIAIRPEWNQFKILVWQYRTSVLKDLDLYRQAGLGGFHIDYGADKGKLVFAVPERCLHLSTLALCRTLLY